MVTCRQIKQLAAARIAGEEASSQTREDASKRLLPNIPSRLPSSRERHSRNVEAPLKSLKPFRFPTTKENQMQTVRTIKRVLGDLKFYLDAHAVTLVDAFPSSLEGGLVEISNLYSWLCSLRRKDNNAKADSKPSVEERRLSPCGDEQMLQTLESFFDPDGSGRAKAKDVVEAIYLARRVATRRRQRRAQIEKRQDQVIALELDGGSQHKTPVGDQEKAPEEVERKSLVSRVGVLHEIDIHELVDIFFSDSDEPSGFVETITLEDLEAQTRLLRRVWAVSRNGNAPTSAPRKTEKKDDEGKVETWERLTQRAASILATLEDFLARKQAMRLMDFVRVIPEVSLDHAERVRMEDLRMSLLKLFDVPLEVRARARIQAAKLERRTRLRAFQIEQEAAALASESRLRRAGVGPLLRRVDSILKRRGIRLGEAVDLARIDEDTISTKKFLALVKAALCEREPLKHQNAQQSLLLSESEDLGSKDRHQITARLERMRIAEKTGGLASFGRLDRFFRRYQLTAEGIWDLGQTPKRGDEPTSADDEARTSTKSTSLTKDDLYKFLQRAQIPFSRDQVRDVFRYLDKDGNGKIEYKELAEALVDYRTFMDAKRRFKGPESSLQNCLCLEHQATLVLQYIVLVGGKQRKNHASNGSFKPKQLSEDSDDTLREECIRLVDMQRAIDVASHQTVSQYVREICDHLRKEESRGKERSEASIHRR